MGKQSILPVLVITFALTLTPDRISATITELTSQELAGNSLRYHLYAERPTKPEMPAFSFHDELAFFEEDEWAHWKEKAEQWVEENGYRFAVITTAEEEVEMLPSLPDAWYEGIHNGNLVLVIATKTSVFYVARYDILKRITLEPDAGTTGQIELLIKSSRIKGALRLLLKSILENNDAVR